MKILLRILSIVIVGYLFIRAVLDFYQIPSGEIWSEKYRPVWLAMLGGWAVFAILVTAGILVAIFRPELYTRIVRAAIRTRGRIGLWRWPAAILLLGLPVLLLLYSAPGLVLGRFYLRLLFGLVTCLLVAALLTSSKTELIQPNRLIFSILLFGSLFVVGDYLTYVTNYPFSLSWSEGNRLYDYSVILGSYRYQYSGKLTNPYNTPGRYLLWGVLFAIHNTPIWLHRLWDAVLWTALPIAFSFVLARWTRLDRFQKAGLALWGFLFLYQGPIYPPLILSALLVTLLVHKNHFLFSLLGVALASYYASSSRWTWAPAPAIWAVMILVSSLEIKPGAGWKPVARQLIPIAAVGALGIAAGYLAKSDFFNIQELSTATSLDQPLLWYRLFPNATYSAGIFLGLCVAAVPLLVWIAWAALSRWWPIHWLQGLIYAIAVLATLVVGLVISVKIGGGSNLHNLDMLFVTLLILTGLVLKDRLEIPWKVWPAWVQVLMVVVFVLPAATAFKTGGPLQLPPAYAVAEAMGAIQDQVARARVAGEVLFMDQRQLLTFGYVQDVPLVMDYEKKYNMDMAMGNNKEYFQAFYVDLARQRFKLIVSDPLRTPKKFQDSSFGNENNSWVKWVAKPVLCYYEPIATFEAVRVQLLVPRPDPVDCP